MREPDKYFYQPSSREAVPTLEIDWIGLVGKLEDENWMLRKEVNFWFFVALACGIAGLIGWLR